MQPQALKQTHSFTYRSVDLDQIVHQQQLEGDALPPLRGTQAATAMCRLQQSEQARLFPRPEAYRNASLISASTGLNGTFAN